ncbi:MAG: hypothetical protein ACREEV_20695, partial [Dongiaceae bacterium]
GRHRRFGRRHEATKNTKKHEGPLTVARSACILLRVLCGFVVNLWLAPWFKADGPALSLWITELRIPVTLRESAGCVIGLNDRDDGLV